MKTRSEFSRVLANLKHTHVKRAVAFLWYYRQSQQFEDRTASELASDIHDEGFPRPNVTKLYKGLSASRYTVRGYRSKSFRIDLRRLSDLDAEYSALLDLRRVEVSNNILPFDWVSGTRAYLEQLVHQINGTYDSGFYDACAVLCRRLMESLIIEVYVNRLRQKLGKEIIQTRRGQGYIFMETD